MSELTLAEYQRQAGRTISSDMPARDLLANFSMGLAGEGGELVDLLKKHLFHGHGLDVGKVKKELGDVIWYVAGIASILSLNLGAIAEANVEKLKARYPEGFSEERSKNRGLNE